MIYFDNAATSWPKPPGVLEAMNHCLTELGANPGRATHKMATQANEMVNKTRQALALLFHIEDPERIIFTLNTTDSLNMALKGLLQPGDHVVTSSMEHNSVTRPLYSLSQQGIRVTKVSCDQTGYIKVQDVKKLVIIQPKPL